MGYAALAVTHLLQHLAHGVAHLLVLCGDGKHDALVVGLTPPQLKQLQRVEK